MTVSLETMVIYQDEICFEEKVPDNSKTQLVKTRCMHLDDAIQFLKKHKRTHITLEYGESVTEERATMIKSKLNEESIKISKVKYE